MGSQHQQGGSRGNVQSLVRAVSLGLAVAAIVKELRMSPEERTWHGVVAGFVPYEFRRPTAERFRARIWNAEADRLIGPHVFGVGWTLNLGKVIAVVREKLAATH